MSKDLIILTICVLFVATIPFAGGVRRSADQPEVNRLKQSDITMASTGQSDDSAEPATVETTELETTVKALNHLAEEVKEQRKILSEIRREIEELRREHINQP